MKNSAIHIRDAHKNERHIIRDLVALSYAEFETVASPSVWKNAQTSIAMAFEEDSPAQYIVAVQDEAIVGSVLLYPSAPPYPDADHLSNVDDPEIRLLAVLPEMRGQGIASALVDECIQRARHAGASGLRLHSADFMKVAVHLYRQKGFVRTPETDVNNEEILITGYRLSLTPPS